MTEKEREEYDAKQAAKFAKCDGPCGCPVTEDQPADPPTESE